MCASPSATVHVPTVYDLMHEQSRSIGAFASTELENVYSLSAHMSAARHATSPSSATRSLADFLDDIFFSYTGVPSWSTFLHIQQEGAALRRQLGAGATFAHEAVHPSLSPALKQWAQALRSQRAARARAIGAGDSPRSTIVVSAAAPRGATSAGKPPFRSESSASATAADPAATLNHNATKSVALMTAGASEDLDSSSSLMERELAAENARAHLPAEEDGVLPLWRDLKLTKRCGPLALQGLRAAVGAYYLALLRLVDITESLADHWGLLSPKELKGLHRAMAAEKAAHVPPSFLFSVFTELNASGERLSNAVADLRKCTRLETVRLTGNAALTELNVLPPHCRVVTACGCSLGCFLEEARSTPPSPPSAAPRGVYALVTTLGLAYNRLRHLHFVQQLPSLRVLNMSFNYVSDLEAAVRDVAAHGSLTEVTLQGNPISLLDAYRTVLVRGCVHLDRLDGVAVTGEERALSCPAVDDGDAAQEDSPGRPLLDSALAGAARKPSCTALPNICGRLRLNVAASPAPPSPQHNPSTRGCVTFGAPPISKSKLVVSMVGSQPPVSDEVLRTTVAAGLDLVMVRGLASLQPVPQTCLADSLLPSSGFLLELAGVVTSAKASVPSGGCASPIQASSLVTSPLASPRTSSVQAGSRKGRHHGGAAGDSGGRGASANGSSTNGKRVVPPLYEVSSRVTVEGCWGGSSVSSGDAPLGSGDGVCVSVEVCLEPPAPLSTYSAGRHAGAPGAPPPRVPSAAQSRQRRAGGTAAATNEETPPLPIPDPYIPARFTAGAGGGGGASCVVSLPVTDTLVCALQQPLVLRVVVQDTFRFAEGEAALRSQLDTSTSSAARGSPVGRSGAGARSATGELPSNLVLPSAFSLGEAPPWATSCQRGSEDAEEEEAVLLLRRELGVITLDPRDLFLVAGDNPATCTGAPCAPTPLPRCRVLYVHDAALERDSHTLKSAEREVRQCQRRLREALATYSDMHHHYKEASRKGLENLGSISPAPSAALGKDSVATGTPSPQPNRRRTSVAVNFSTAVLPLPSASSSKQSARSRPASVLTPPAHTSQLQGLYASLKAEQLRVAQRALRVLALRTRLDELRGASLSVGVRFCVGRGAVPPPSTAADAELEALRHPTGSPKGRKGRQQAAKGTRR
ncbi:hypothetical protein LdCL_300010400 [Leishmania donovani]|uniref:Uncharacterized protein n=1 Tax=Leishmania donovani TaxID=5661 RepID=A0A3S7X318_LEIDO|nr:hypothetical protein LdCL_300010400 [Leishmania donovani]